MFQFKHPFTCLICGPTQSGKTEFMLELLQNLSTMVTPTPTRIIWCYGEWQNKLGQLPKSVRLSEGLAGIHDINPEEKNLLILDDLMDEAGEASEVSELFTKGSHHRNLSVVFITQNLFHQGKKMRTISLNAHYFVLFKNPRDAGQIRHLATQLFPGQTKYLVDAYKQATSRPHGYLLLDLTQSTPDNRRVLSDVLPDEEKFFYLPR
jgi:hypothetical protein